MLFSSRIRRPAVASATRSPASVRQTRLLRAPDGSRYKMPSASSLRRAELVSQWALTDQTLAMTALCLRHVPAEKERVLRCFSDELSEERDRLLHLLGDADECARLAASQPFFPPPATHEGYFTEECL